MRFPFIHISIFDKCLSTPIYRPLPHKVYGNGTRFTEPCPSLGGKRQERQYWKAKERQPEIRSLIIRGTVGMRQTGWAKLFLSAATCYISQQL